MTTNADSETDELEEPKTTRVIFHNSEQKDTNADSETDEPEEPKTTRVIFHNPEQKDTPEVYSRDKTAREHFEAALFVKREIGAHRTLLFGDLIAAVVEVEKEDDPTDLIRFCNKLIDQDLEVVQSKNIELKEA